MYNEFYGFSKKPFELTPDPEFLYLTPGHREALASMISGIRERRGFISITGEVGTGKTTLIHYLLSTLDEKVKTIFIFHTTITFRDLLKNILLELDLAVAEESKTGLLDQLTQCLTRMAIRDETLAIIIDEAQHLSKEVMEELRMFSNLEPKVIQIVFVGQPEFEDKLNSQDLRQLKQKIEIKRQIRPLSEEESKEYIDHRLRLVGSSSSEVFTPKAVSMISLYAQGIPRIINILCDNAFLIGYSLSKKKVDVDIIREVKKNIEGPRPQKTILSSIKSNKEFWPYSLRFMFYLKRASIALLSLIFLGGLIFLLYGHLQQRTIGTWSIESLKRPPVDTELYSTPPSLKTTTEGISKIDIRQSLEKDKLKEIIAVEKGQTISYLAIKYYRMVNETLIDLILDFNPEITNAHLIKVDQKIKIPKITEELLIIKSSDHTYKIHVGTFWRPDLAQIDINEKALKGKEIEIIPRKISPQDTWYRVVVGKFDNKDEALRMIHLLQERGRLSSFGGDFKRE
jgi:general secretion pathway protein A